MLYLFLLWNPIFLELVQIRRYSKGGGQSYRPYSVKGALMPWPRIRNPLNTGYIVLHF